MSAAKEPGLGDPILTVIWRGHRVVVLGDRDLAAPAPNTRGGQPESRAEIIVRAITTAASVEGMVSALEASEVGKTHAVEVRMRERVLQIRLQRRSG